MKTTSDCPSRGQLAQFLDDSLPREAESKLSKHLANCDACRLQVEAILAEESPFAEQESGQHSTSILRLLSDVDQRLRDSPAAAPALESGWQIDGYKLQKLLSDDQDGMGEVWQASQLNPIRDVAVKIIGARRLQQSSLDRFEREKQAIAQLNHDRIARLYDTGVTDSGRPWFAMEFVSGLHVTDFCRRYSLGLGKRIELFLLVCEAVQAAHFAGIVHRDLKPANILVAGDSENPRPKLIDFGIALREEDVLANDRQTVTESVMGTFRYMSPEQASGRLAPFIDYRTDIYSLGVLLHELICGLTPSHRFAPKGLSSRQMLAIAEAAEVSRPSKFVTDHEAQITEHLAGLKTTAASFSARLREDLDWIVLKSLEREAKARYESVQDLAADLRRYLSYEPVMARTLKSTPYRLRKSLRKNRKTLSIAGAVGALLLMLLTAVGYQWWDSSRRSAEQLAGSTQINQTVSTLIDEVENDIQRLVFEQQSAVGWKKLRTDTAIWDRRLQTIDASIQQAELVRTTTDYDVDREIIDRLDGVRERYRELLFDRRELWQSIRAIRDQTMVRSSHGDTSTFRSKNTAYSELLSRVFPGDLQDQSADQLAVIISEGRTPWLWTATLDDYAQTFRGQRLAIKQKIREVVMRVDDDEFRNSIRRLDLVPELHADLPLLPDKIHEHILQLATSRKTNDLPVELLTLLQSGLIASGNLETARQVISDAAWNQTNDHNLWIVLSSAHEAPELQLTALSAALALDPDSFVVHGKLGVHYLDAAERALSVGDFQSIAKLMEDSERHLRLALKYSEPPLSALFYHNLGLVSELRQEVKRASNPLSMIFGVNNTEAIEHYRSAVAIDPRQSTSWNNLGRLLGEINNQDESEAAYRNAIAANPSGVNSHYNLGLLLKFAGRFDEAEQSFRNLLAVDKNHIAGLSQLGELLLKRKVQAEAIEVFSSLLELSLEHPDHGEGSVQVRYAEQELSMLKKQQSMTEHSERAQ